jgi:hypothetical protein
MLLSVSRVFADEPTASPEEERVPVPATEERHPRRKIVLVEQPSAAEAAARQKQTREETLRTLALLDALDGFQCRVSEECLSRPVSKPVGVDLVFQDVIVGVPVSGQARLEGALQIDLAPDKEHVSFDVILTGAVALKGTGRSQDVQIRTDTIVDFHAMKRLQIDQQGITSLPATCTATAAITMKEISSSRPRLLGKFSERVAQKRSVSSKEAAEAQSAEHLAEAISEHLDREVAAVVAVVNAALADHLKAADETAKSRWSQIRFNTADEWIHIARPSAGKELLHFAAAQDKTPSPLVLQLPRARLDVNVVLTGMRYLQQDGQQPAASSHVAVRQPVKFRPVVELGSDTITFRFEFDEPAKLAQDAPAAKISTMP